MTNRNTEAVVVFQRPNNAGEVAINLRLVRTAQPHLGGTRITFDKDHAVIVSSRFADITKFMMAAFDEAEDA